ncbi:MAG: hypothetical protein CL681_29475 [Blastopirellula sp.]|nr:hypothetical protein [Blastopirellula sp.]|tara:strand:+ start:144 stop:347 length:204 start_codon:yes stop_codon:yes gene_type:complete
MLSVEDAMLCRRSFSTPFSPAFFAVGQRPSKRLFSLLVSQDELLILLEESLQERCVAVGELGHTKSP